jgi:hypothetical protein
VPKALRSVSTFRTGPAAGMSVGTLRIHAATTCGCDLTTELSGALATCLRRTTTLIGASAGAMG